MIPGPIFLRCDPCFAVEEAGEERGALEPQPVGDFVDG